MLHDYDLRSFGPNGARAPAGADQNGSTRVPTQGSSRGAGDLGSLEEILDNEIHNITEQIADAGAGLPEQLLTRSTPSRIQPRRMGRPSSDPGVRTGGRSAVPTQKRSDSPRRPARATPPSKVNEPTRSSSRRTSFNLHHPTRSFEDLDQQTPPTDSAEPAESVVTEIKWGCVATHRPRIPKTKRSSLGIYIENQ